MSSNFHLFLTQDDAAREYGVELPEEIDQSYFPYRPTAAHAPTKTYSLPQVVMLENGLHTLRQMRWGLLSHWATSEFDMPQPNHEPPSHKEAGMTQIDCDELD